MSFSFLFEDAPQSAALK